MLSAAVESSPVQWSPVLYRYVAQPQYIVKSSEVQWNPVESSGVHVDYVGDGKVLILDANDEDEPSWIPIVTEGGGTGRAAAMGYGSRALRVGIEDGSGNGIIIVLPCRRTGLRVLPEGDHMNAMFAP